MKPLVAFRSNNVLQPCRKALVSLRYKLKRRLTILIRRRGSAIPLLLRRLRPSKSSPSPPSSARSITSRRSSKKTLKGKVSSFFSTFFRHNKNKNKKKKNKMVRRDLSNSFSQLAGERHDKVVGIERLMSSSFPHYSPKKGVVSRSGGRKLEKEDELAVEDACRSFENYLVEMIVEEGKVRDLMDVEELLYCWNNLKCPVFIDLVSRFYGELCKDLFMDLDQQEDDE